MVLSVIASLYHKWAVVVGLAVRWPELMTLEQTLNALTFAVENPVQRRRVLGVAKIRANMGFDHVTCFAEEDNHGITKAHARGTFTPLTFDDEMVD